MSFPPAFLEELRARLPLAGQVMRRVKLTRHGREYQGLCPFHHEKSPSFTVSEEKGFFHCFGCGAHGDVISFAMRIDNLSFIEAIERLAAEAGVEVPKLSPLAREEAARAKTLYEVLDAACTFFQQRLAAPEGAMARRYLAERALHDAADRFRLGYAPADGGTLRQSLMKEFPPALIEQAGLIRLPEDGREAFDYFRDRLIFPILDRRGRVIAFGGRVLGDGKPKYLNSPETPVFHKGEQLYGGSWAKEGVHRGAELIVTEGYVDVIRLHMAGFSGAVAPLGTAVTEAQLEQLWSMGPEPILCFDGDSAGARAAARAMMRALPLLKPGRSLRFAMLPRGEDPDTLIRHHGAAAMGALLQAAKPLVEMLWEQEVSRAPADTPERRSGLEHRLMEASQQIGDVGVKREYQRYFRNCLFERLRNRTRSSVPTRKPFAKSPTAWQSAALGGALPTPRALCDKTEGERLQQKVLLRLIVDAPDLLEEQLEPFAALRFPAPDLDRLKRAIINIHASGVTLDSKGLREHLQFDGFGGELRQLDAPEVTVHVMFAKPGTDPEILRRGLSQAFDIWRSQHERVAEQEDAIRLFCDQPGEEAWERVQALPAASERELAQQIDVEKDRPE